MALNLYCLMLPIQRGVLSGWGRNMPTNTWFRYVPWVLTLTGKLAEANTPLTAMISSRMVEKATFRSAKLSLSKYLPPPFSASVFKWPG